MALDTATKSPDAPASADPVRTKRARSAGRAPTDGRRRTRPLVLSRLTRLIVLANVLGLAILTAGVLALGETRQGLIQARFASLRTQGELVASALGALATEPGGTLNEPVPRLDADAARALLRALYVGDSVRMRLFATNGAVITDSYLLGDEVLTRDLPPIGETRLTPNVSLDEVFDGADDEAGSQSERTLDEEFSRALLGRVVENQRANEAGERVVSVSIPVRRVQEVLGVLTVEAADVDAIIAAERRALMPFLAVAFAVTLTSSILITLFVARPIRRLSVAADLVREEGPRRASIPDLSARRDEIGDLSVTLNAMTQAIAERIDTIEAFAADVAHEVKNPLTSIRSALETLPQVDDEERRARLLEVMRHDVQRIDRLITDISNASRLDAELARVKAEPLDLVTLLREMVELYAELRRDGEAPVVFTAATPHVLVNGAEATLGRVFRNLIDNAKTFSPPGGTVRVTVSSHVGPGFGAGARVTIDDDGPGVPEDNREQIFKRFYTERPKGAAFGSHSGLGLAIARQIVTAHDGRIFAENRRDEAGAIVGARFVVELPERRR
jgi:two-component system sensor histidine kinase ChvG